MAKERDYFEVAMDLEQHDRLSEAEALIKTEAFALGYPYTSQTSYMYELRTKRLNAEGRTEEARKAAQLAVYFSRDYASGATSGGEGISRSRDADRLQIELQTLLNFQLDQTQFGLTREKGEEF